MEFRNVALGELSNPDIVLKIYKNYFTSNEASSSHWKYQGDTFSVEFDGLDRLKLAKGGGFGDFKHRWPHDFVFDLLTIASYLAMLPERRAILGQMKIARALGFSATYDVFRNGAITVFLRQWVKHETPRILIIGDGGGVLTAFLKENWAKARFISINLGKVLIFESLLLQEQFPRASFALADQGVQPDVDISFVPAEAVNSVSFHENSIDLAINVASMQEMTGEWIARYFQIIRHALKPDGLFYCCNRIHKVLPGGEVTAIMDFPWKDEDVILVDEEPKFCRWFFSWAPSARRLRLGLIPVPFGRLFDGQVWHRLVKMAK